MTKTARHPLRRRFSGGNATGRGSFGTTCGTARPACGPAAAHDDGPDRTRRLPTPGRRPPGCTPTLRHTNCNARHTPNPKHSARRRNARARHEPPYDPPAQTAFDAQKRTIRRPYPIPEIPYASHDRKGAACRKRSQRIAPRSQPVGPRCKRAAPPIPPRPTETGGSRSPPVLHKNRPQSPPRRTSYRSRSPPASHASCPQTHGPADKRLQPGLPSPPQTHRPQAAAPTGRRTGRRLGRKIEPGPKSAPALRSPDERAQKKNGFRSTRKPFRSIFYSCVSVSGSATRMRPQYSQMMIFLPCRMSD